MPDSCVYAPSGDSTREQLARRRFIGGLQNYMENKNKKIKKKKHLETLIVLCIKWRGMVEIKHRLYRCCFNYALLKLIVDNGLVELWRKENPESSEFNRYDRSSGTRSRIDRVYTDIKIASNTKIDHIMVSFTYHYHAISIDRFPSQTKIGKDSWYFNNSLLCKPDFSSTTYKFFIKNTKKATIQQFSKWLVGKHLI